MLTWTAPGDDADQGTADSYDIRYWEQEIVDDNDFENNATKVSAGLIPSPQPAGFPETFSLGGFGHEEVLWIAMKSRDENANASDLSNVLKVATPGTPPSTVTGLQVVEAAATGTSVRLQWIAPPDDAGDNSSGPVDRYDIRCSTSPIPDVATFQALPSIGIGPVPVTPGETQIFDVPGLANQTNYNCVVQAIDDAGLGSGLGTTQGSTLDAIAPNPASELQVDLTIGGLPVVAVEVSGERTNKVGFLKENAIDGNVATKWSTPGRNSVTTEFIKLDFGAVVEMNLVRLRSDDGGASRFPHDFTIQVSTDDIVYTVVHTENDFIATGSTWYDFPFATTSVRFVKIEVTEQRSSLGQVLHPACGDTGSQPRRPHCRKRYSGGWHPETTAIKTRQPPTRSATVPPRFPKPISAQPYCPPEHLPFRRLRGPRKRSPSAPGSHRERGTGLRSRPRTTRAIRRSP